MNLLFSILFLIVTGMMTMPIFAEPVVYEDGSIHTTILRTPEFTVDASQFSETNQIIIDVKFENTGNLYHGLAKVTETPYDENGLDDPDEVYEKYHKQRLFFVYLTNITNSSETILDREQFMVTSNDDFIKINGATSLRKAFEVEILDIDELVPWTSTGKALIQTQLKLSSPELLPDNIYILSLWTDSDHNSDADTKFTLSSKSTKPTLQPPTPAPMEMPSDIEEQMKLQQQKALEEHEQRKKQREAENNLRPENTGQDKPENIESKERTSQDRPDNTQRDTESQRPETMQNEKPENAGQAKPEYIPEPTTVKPKPQCGTGTILVNGYCQVVKSEPVQEKGFVQWLMSLFGM